MSLPIPIAHGACETLGPRAARAEAEAQCGLAGSSNTEAAIGTPHPFRFAVQSFAAESASQWRELVADVEPFEAEDELYLCEYHGEVVPLLETRFRGKAPGFAEDEWQDDAPRLVMYLHPVGQGEVLYLTLGHCRGHYDMQPLMNYYPKVERGSWELPVFYDLLRRGLSWALLRPHGAG